MDFTGAGTLSRDSQAMAKAHEAERSSAYRRLLLHMNAVDDTERRLGVTTRWTVDSPEYQDALKYLNNRAFIRTVEHLEGLVVQRLFELSKANLASTGKHFTYVSLFTFNCLQGTRCENISPKP
jgi:hypothetical protein